MPLHSWLFLCNCAVRFGPIADRRELRSQGGLIRKARGMSWARCCTAVDRWKSGWWWRGLDISLYGNEGDGFFGFGLMGLEPTTDGREKVSRARLVCRIREKSRAGCCAVVDRREFG